MVDRIRYAGRLVDRMSEPLPDAILNLEIYTLEDGWVAIDEAESQADGQFKRSLRTDDLSNSRFVPQFRLVDPERELPYRSTPTTTVSRNVLVLEFGTVVNDERSEANKIDLDPSVVGELKKLRLQLYASQLEAGETQTRLDRLSSSLDSVTTERDDLALQLDRIRTAETASPKIGDLAGRLATSLIETSSPDDTNGFRLDGATVTLKGYLADGGNRFKPLDAAELASANAAGASEISFRLRPPAVAGDTGVTMPDVIGLTAATARRTLRPLGAAVQVVEGRGTPVGAVVAQTPEPGATIEPGSVIHLQVATES